MMVKYSKIHLSSVSEKQNASSIIVITQSNWL